MVIIIYTRVTPVCWLCCVCAYVFFAIRICLRGELPNGQRTCERDADGGG